MVKRRICESCLYFESAGFAKNGWCHHPSRRQNSDVRLMVRSNELGCRNGWDADLWVPADADGSTQTAQPHRAIGARAASEVEPAEQSDLITSIVAAKTDNMSIPDVSPPPATPPIARAYVEEDIFVKQTPSLNWSNGPISAQPATELVQNPKAAILRARDQYRLRRKSEGRLADRHLASPSGPLLASSREAQQTVEREIAPLEPDPESLDPRYENRPLLRPQPGPQYASRKAVSPVTLGEMERPFPSMTDFPEDRVRFESVPYLEEPAGADEDLGRFDDDAWIETRQLDTIPSEPYVIDEFFEDDESVVLEERELHEEEELSVRHRESILNRYLRQRRERRQTYVYADEPGESLGSPRVTQSPVTTAAPQVDPRRLPNERSLTVSNSDQMAETRPSLDDEFVLPPPLPEYQPSNDSASTSPYRQRNQSPARSSTGLELEDRGRSRTVAASDEFGDQPLFASGPALDIQEDYEIYASNGKSPQTVDYPGQRMERICQTCRDFRPTDTGERGWCNNKWAFNHRRMVDAEDLACRNSLGSWWTPKDDVWRRDGDISRHAMQTPRVDQWLFGISTDEQGRRRSGS